MRVSTALTEQPKMFAISTCEFSLSSAKINAVRNPAVVRLPLGAPLQQALRMSKFSSALTGVGRLSNSFGPWRCHHFANAASWLADKVPFPKQDRFHFGPESFCRYFAGSFLNWFRHDLRHSLISCRLCVNTYGCPSPNFLSVTRHFSNG